MVLEVRKKPLWLEVDMHKVIVSGRGGSGKSTLVALLSKKLGEKGDVLVVDADESNLGLPSMLGIDPPEQTVIGHIGGKPAVGEKLMKSFQSGGDEKVQLFEQEMGIEDLPPEIRGGSGPVSLVRIGKIEHSMEGCACPMGATARGFLSKLAVDERGWVLVDTEAGLEHFGRGVLEGADLVLMVVDPSHEAVLLARKAAVLCAEAGKTFGVILTKVNEQSQPILEDRLSSQDLDVIGVLPYSEEITRANLDGSPLETGSIDPCLDSILGAMGSRA